MKKVTLTINGKKKQFSVADDKVPMDLLREDLHLTGVKQSCDRKGQCGACTVVVDGKAVKSCLKKVVDLQGTDVITVEGLGTPDNPHLIQEAFVLSGAIQCGYCTPGMIMATKALLDKNPDPTVADIKKALARNLCRCTGYTKIIDAVRLAGQFMRGENAPAKIRKGMKKAPIGESHPRPSAMIKACGLAQFTADIPLPGALELAVVHSTEFHAKILSIDTSKAKKMPGVAGIMLADDIKGTNRIRMLVPDQPILCEDVVRTYGDPIAIVAAETRDQARNAAAAVKVNYEKLPVMMTPEESLALGAYQIHKHSPNLCYYQPQIKGGDIKKSLAKSAAVVEGTFSTQINYQAPLEPDVCIAYFEGKGKKETLVVVGRSINIHAHADQLKEAVGAENVRYLEPFVGGQFGIKSIVTTEGIPAAAAMYFKRAVRYIPNLPESMWMTSKRHSLNMQVKLGADKKGYLTGYANDFTVNKGAYFLLGPIIPKRAFHMFNGSYNIPDVHGTCKVAYTNNISGGAARGAGPPQVIFALESAMDMLAEKLKIDPLEFRKQNALRPGQTRSTGAPITQTSFPQMCDAVKEHYERAKKEAKAFNKKSSNIKRGVGVAGMSFGIGSAGDKGVAAVEIDKDDFVTIYAAIADPGEGNDSMLTQLAAKVLGLPLNKIKLHTRDTVGTVGMGPAAGSRMTYIGGGSAVLALQKLKKAMNEAKAKTYAGLKEAGKAIRYEASKVVPGSEALDPKTGQGDSFESQVDNIQMAEVEVNIETGEVKVLKMTTAVDAGPIIHPQNLQGQLEGGMDQGIGYALREEYVHGKSKDWITFKFPTINEAADVELIALETPRPTGTLGSTGIGEMTMVSTAPAVTNAIYNACGVRIYDLPATAEKIKAGLVKK